MLGTILTILGNSLAERHFFSLVSCMLKGKLVGGGDKIICFVLYWYIHVDVFSLEFEEQRFWKERGILN